MGQKKKTQVVNYFKSSISKDDFPKKWFYLVAGAILVLLLAIAPTAGVNGDEDVQEQYSLDIVNYYTTMGQDTACFNSVKGPQQRYYGGFFEVIAGSTNKFMGLTPEDTLFHHTRHIWIALFGFFIVFFIGKWAADLGGNKLGILAMIILFLSPRFFGHSLMNPKDIPFALGFVMSMYYMYKSLADFNNITRKTLIFLGLSFGIAIGSRIGGLLVVAYWGLFLILHFIVVDKFNFSKIKQYVIAGLLPLAIGWIMGLLFWPYGLQAPISHTAEALKEFSNFSTSIRILFGGDLIWSSQVPASYIPVWALHTYPVIVLLGLVISLGLIMKLAKQFGKGNIFIIVFSFVFPVLYIILKGSGLYGAMRHVLFIYPTIVLFASLGIFWIYNFVQKNKTYKYVFYGVLLIGLLEPAVFIARNIHYPYVYFNPLVGGVGNNFGYYQQDYWGIGVKEAVDWLKENEDLKDGTQLTSNFIYALQRYTRDLPNVGKRYTRFRQRFDRDWDYAIYVGRFIDETQLRSGAWPSQKVIYTVESQGAPLVVVYKNKTKNAYNGLDALKNGKLQEAQTMLEAEVKDVPDNDLAWMALARIYFNNKQQDKADKAVSEVLRINPGDAGAMSMNGLILLNQNKISEAEKMFLKAIEKNDRDVYSHYYLALIYFKKGDYNPSLKHIKATLQYNNRFKQAYMLAADVYDKLGDSATAQKYRGAAAKLK